MSEKNISLPLDLAYLSSLSAKERCQWLRANSKDISSAIWDRTRELLGELEPPTLSLTDEDRFYTTGNFEKLFRNGAEIPSPVPSAHIVPYCAIRGDELSCQQLIFGEPSVVNLYGRTLAFVSQISALSATRLDKVISSLRKSPVQTNNPIYIVTNRCNEVAASKGVSTSVFCAPFYSSLKVKAILPCLRTGGSRQGDFTGSADYNRSNTFMLFAIALSAGTGLSLDYWLLQDYSRHAAIDGKLLSELEQKALSAFLCAEPDAQAAAMGEIISAKLGY